MSEVPACRKMLKLRTETVMSAPIQYRDNHRPDEVSSGGKRLGSAGPNRIGLTRLGTLTFFLLATICATSVQARSLAGLPDFTRLVEQTHPAVVNISTTTQKKRTLIDQVPGLEIPDLEGTPFEDLLKKYWGEQDLPPDHGQRPDNSLGSGFIISADGYILTNNHVVADADEIIVRLDDRRQLIAELVGADARSDVALLKVEAGELPIATIGRSSELKVGEWVLAIGSPFGFDFSVTAGIVSAKGRALPNENYVPFIQTDVAINPGNSGGPLFNLEGEVVGINSQIYSRTGGFMGLSFAIPIEMAMDIADQLRTGGVVSRGWLGVVIQEVTRELAESFGMRTAHGALIARILPDGPAGNSELQVGDIITHFNGRKVEMSAALPPMVGQVRANTTIEVEVLRDGRMRTLEVTIGELPGEDELRNARARETAPTGQNRLAMTVEPLDDDTRNRLGIDRGGVLVSTVDDGGPAAKAGIEPGIALLSIDNAPIDSTDDFNQVLREIDTSKPVAVLVQRESGPEFLAVRIDP